MGLKSLLYTHLAKYRWGGPTSKAGQDHNWGLATSSRLVFINNSAAVPEVPNKHSGGLTSKPEVSVRPSD
jgi:hypothetical protein